MPVVFTLDFSLGPSTFTATDQYNTPEGFNVSGWPYPGTDPADALYPEIVTAGAMAVVGGHAVPSAYLNDDGEQIAWFALKNFPTFAGVAGSVEAQVTPSAEDLTHAVNAYLFLINGLDENISVAVEGVHDFPLATPPYTIILKATNWNGSDPDVSVEFPFVADVPYTMRLAWQCGTVLTLDGDDIDTMADDGWVRFYLDDVLVLELTDVALYLDTGPAQLVTTVWFGFFNLFGATNLIRFWSGVTPDPPAIAPRFLLFDGFIVSVREGGKRTRNPDTILTEVAALSQYSLLDRRHLGLVIPAGPLKAALIVVAAFVPGLLTPLAVHPDQVDGPDLPALIVDVVTLAALVEKLQELTGYFAEVRGNYLRMWPPGEDVAPFAIVDGSRHLIGDVTVEKVRDADYANQVIVQQANPAGGFFDNLVVFDEAEMIAHGVWDLVITVAPEMGADEKYATALALLARSIVLRREVTYVTETNGLRPGQAQHLTLPTRNVDGDFLITDVDIQDVRVNVLRYTVHAIEGTVFKPGWRAALKGVVGVSGSVTVRE